MPASSALIAYGVALVLAVLIARWHRRRCRTEAFSDLRRAIAVLAELSGTK